MSQNTTNSTAFIEAQQFSQFILDNIHDGLLPAGLWRDVSDFGAGTTLNIKSVGTVQIQETAEDTPVAYTPIDTGNVTLTITDYVSDGWYITDVLRQDGAQIEQLLAARGMESTRAIQERFETRFLEVMNGGQTVNNNNLINGFAHRYVASGTNDVITLDDLAMMKLAFDKANMPQAGRVALVDPVVEATINRLVVSNSGFRVDYNPRWQAIVEEGFAREHKFLFNLFGWDFWTTNRLAAPTDTALPDFAAANATDVSSGYVANLFMCVADDQCKPGMVAWRQMPSVEGERNKDRGRDEYVTRARWGQGVQRLDGLGVIATSATATA